MNIKNMLYIGAAYITLANTAAFISTGIEKMAGTSKEDAAIIHVINDGASVCHIGYSLGHEYFYGDSDYLKTARNISETRKIERLEDKLRLKQCNGPQAISSTVGVATK